jgi:hypothetical protein
MNDCFYPVLFKGRKEDILIEEFKVVVEILGAFAAPVVGVR